MTRERFRRAVRRLRFLRYGPRPLGLGPLSDTQILDIAYVWGFSSINPL